MEQVREVMLAALDTCGDSRFLGLKTRIRFACDAQRMWDLRSELMKALASDQGEARAGEKLQLITGMFRDILPKGLASGLATTPVRAPAPDRQKKPQENFTNLKSHGHSFKGRQTCFVQHSWH